MKRNSKPKITDKMIGSDPFGTCCSTIADKMIIASDQNTGGEEVAAEVADLNQVSDKGSKRVKKKEN